MPRLEGAEMLPQINRKFRNIELVTGYNKASPLMDESRSVVRSNGRGCENDDGIYSGLNQRNVLGNFRRCRGGFLCRKNHAISTSDPGLEKAIFPLDERRQTSRAFKRLYRDRIVRRLGRVALTRYCKRIVDHGAPLLTRCCTITP